jgi:hypothetical protein
MADSSETTTDEQEEELEVEAVESESDADEATLDMDAVAERDGETETEALRERIEEQQEEIEELQDLMLDLSVRVADDKGMGVCPDCHGPVMKRKRLIRRSTIECARCGRVFHEY